MFIVSEMFILLVKVNPVKFKIIDNNINKIAFIIFLWKEIIFYLNLFTYNIEIKFILIFKKI